MYKNVSGQKVIISVRDGITGELYSGDANNITAVISKDGGTFAATDDTNPAEIGTTGFYVFDLTQEETNADLILFVASTTTANKIIEPLIIYTEPNAEQIKSAIEQEGSFIASIKTKTDNLPDSPAAVGSEMTLDSSYNLMKNFWWYSKINPKQITGYSPSNGGYVVGALSYPSAYYYNGKTYFAIMMNIANGSKSYITYYDHITQTQATPILVHTPTAADNHAHGAVLVTKTGHILFAVEKLDSIGQVHPSTICIYRTSSPEDINTFVKVAEVGNNSSYTRAYPYFYYVNDKIYLILRDYSPGLFLYSSNDDGLTWNGGVAGTQIVDATNSPGRSWMYVVSVQNTPDKIRLMISERITLVYPERWRYVFYMESADGDIWYNITGDHSHKVSSSGAITRTDLLNYYIWDETGSDSILNRAAGSVVYSGEDDIVYSVNSRGSDRYLTYYRDGVKYQKLLPFTVEGAGTVVTIVYTPDVIECIYQEDGIFKRTRTIDGGDNWADIEIYTNGAHSAWHVVGVSNSSFVIPNLLLFTWQLGPGYYFTLSELNSYLGEQTKILLTRLSQNKAEEYKDEIKAKTDNLPANPAAVGSEMKLENGAIKADTYDNVTAFPKNEMIY